MGAWSEEPYGNDTASDWAWELDDAESWEPVTAVLRDYLAADDSDASQEEIAVAAAEAVAHGVGSPTQDDEYTESVSAFVKRVGTPPVETIAAALESLQKVSSGDSELAQLWAESDDISAWRNALERTRAALSS